MPRSIICIGLLLLPFLSGCGGITLVPVQGVVLLDGSPLPGATVNFVRKGEGKAAEGRGAVGVTDEKGEFTLTTDGRPGAMPGEYMVLIAVVAKPSNQPKPMKGEAAPNEEPTIKIPSGYSSQAKTPFKSITIPSTTPLKFELESTLVESEPDPSKAKKRMAPRDR